MTQKIRRFFETVSFWNKVRGALTALGASGEFAVWANQAGEGWHWVVGIATVLSIFITYFITDSDNDGVVDSFEDKRTKTMKFHGVL
jgi:hypothetical protein